MIATEYDEDFSDLDEFEDTDDFSDLDEFDEPEAVPNLIDLGKPLCATCGNGDVIPGPVARSKCQKCGRAWGWDTKPDKPAATGAASKRKKGEPIFIMSGHCRFPQTARPDDSHDFCHRHGAGSHANPAKEFYPCPCPCHYPEDRFECGGCDGTLVEAAFLGLDEDGDAQYVHLGVDRVSGKPVVTHVLCENKP